MAIWFYAPNFRFSNDPSRMPNGRNIPAYYGVFQMTERPGYIVRLCMLHDDDLGRFPYRENLSEAIAVLYAQNNGLEVYQKPTSGFISRTHAWVRYRYEQPDWQRFTQVRFRLPGRRNRSQPPSPLRENDHERSRSRS